MSLEEVKVKVQPDPVVVQETNVPPTQEQQPANSVLEKFQKIEHNFNKNFLLTLYQIRSIVEGETDEKDMKQFELLDNAYTTWWTKLQNNPKNSEACALFYDAVKDYHELLMKRDTQIFTINGDFFSNIFGETGIDTPYLFDCLRDGLDSDDEGEEDQVNGDAKENLWSSIIGLYRLCVLIMIYLKMPLVKEVIDMILVSNPDLTQSNIFAKIFTEFKGKRRLRKLIMKLLKSNEDSFSDIFTSLSKVIATFSSEVSPDMNMKSNMEIAKKKVNSMFDDILTQVGVTTLNDVVKTQLLERLEEKKSLEDFIEEKHLTQQQVHNIQDLYKTRGLDKMNVNKVVKDLGSVMSDMMGAIQSGNEDDIKKILANAGGGLNMDPAELEKMQSELEKFEHEDDADDDDDEESK